MEDTKSSEGSVKDWYAAKRQMKQQKRKANAEYSTAFLIRKRIPFTSLNGGVMLRIDVKGLVIDFFPSTGLWLLKDGTRNRGIFNLWKSVRDKL